MPSPTDFVAKPLRGLGGLFAEYDPATGRYLGPDGQEYTQADLARQGAQSRTSQEMLLPPTEK